jgi:hypothetical protein
MTGPRTTTPVANPVEIYRRTEKSSSYDTIMGRHRGAFVFANVTHSCSTRRYNDPSAILLELGTQTLSRRVSQGLDVTHSDKHDREDHNRGGVVVDHYP